MSAVLWQIELSHHNERARPGARRILDLYARHRGACAGEAALAGAR